MCMYMYPTRRYITVHGMQQNSQDPPSPVGHSMQPVLGPAGFATEVMEEAPEVGRTALMGVVRVENAMVALYRV